MADFFNRTFQHHKKTNMWVQQHIGLVIITYENIKTATG